MYGHIYIYIYAEIMFAKYKYYTYIYICIYMYIYVVNIYTWWIYTYICGEYTLIICYLLRGTYSPQVGTYVRSTAHVPLSTYRTPYAESVFFNINKNRQNSQTYYQILTKIWLWGMKACPTKPKQKLRQAWNAVNMGGGSQSI